jgi:type I site-specific restriction endonuclease
MIKKQFSERDICTKFITPALEQAGWDVSAQLQAAQAELKQELMAALGGRQ